MSVILKKYIVSACLTGLCTRYDGQSKPSSDCLRLTKGCHYIPVCPEQLGGLPTPRPPADLTGGDGHAVLAGRASVITHDGTNLSEQFIKGAEMVLFIARQQEVDGCLLKAGSPSCGLHPRAGVTAALLLQNGFTVHQF